MGNVLTKIELHPNQIPDDLKKYFRPKRKYGTWIIRNLINWVKPNPMPSSAKDRFTVDFELVIFMVKSKRYFFEPQYEQYTAPLDRWGGDKLKANGESTWDAGTSQNAYRDRDMRPNPLGRNKRTTWTIPTEAFPAAHFATFPRKLVEPMIESGCPRYVCTKCGTPRRKMYERGDMVAGRKQDAQYAKNALNKDMRTVRAKGWNTESTFCPGMSYEHHFKGYSTCSCKEPKYRPGIVLDMFGGSCTTAVVAHEHGRDYIMVELSPEYVKIGEKRLAKQTERYGLLD